MRLDICNLTWLYFIDPAGVLIAQLVLASRNLR
jgi:hypothetical protein